MIPQSDTTTHSVAVDEDLKPPVTKFSVTVGKPMFKVMPEGDTRSPIPMINYTRAEHMRRLASYPNFDPSLSPGAKEWGALLKPGYNSVLADDWLSNVALKGDWQQGVLHNGNTIKASRHGFNSKEGVLTGEQALSHIQYVFGVGIYVSIPLWHSGIWITIKAPKDSELLALERMISEEKIMLGRLTSGFVFSNQSVYISQHLFNFIIDHIYDCNVKDYTRDSLRSLILQTDLPTMIWGLATAIYPNGWPVSIPCTTNPEKCLHIEKAIVDIGKLSLTNLDEISLPMRNHMAVRSVKYTGEQIIGYQKLGKIGSTRNIVIEAPNGNVTLMLSVPTVQKHVDAGDRWISEIKTTINDIFDETHSMTAIDEFALRHARLTKMREYTHWVQQIHIDDVLIMTGNNELDGALDAISSSEEATEQFFKEIRSFIEEVTVSFICVQNFDCPKCGDPIRSVSNPHPEVIPLDVSTLFFALKDRRLTRDTKIRIEK